MENFKKVDFGEKQARRERMIFNLPRINMIQAYAELNDAIVSDRYRDEFMKLVLNETVQGLAADVLWFDDPIAFLEQSHMMGMACEAFNKHGIAYDTIGGPINALKHLVNCAMKK